MTDKRLSKQEGHKTYFFDDDDEATIRETPKEDQFDDEPTVREGNNDKKISSYPKYKAAFGKDSSKYDHRKWVEDEDTLRMPEIESTVKMPRDYEERELDVEPEAYLLRQSDGRKIWITRSYFYVGSEMGDNDYTLRNKYVSRQHAVIRKIDQGGYVIRDLGSMNGTFVDRQKIKPGISKVLHDGSRVRLADEVFIFHINE